MALVATGLTNPRSIQFDTLGNLLVLQDGSGIANLVFQDDGGTCLSVKSTRDVIKYKDLNHGLALSRDGKTIYASSSEAVFSWAYDPENASTSGTKKTLVSGMFNTDHNTRTILLSQKADGLLLVSRGSTSNIDAKAEVLSTGHSQLRAFNLTNITADGYAFTTDGLRLGWGLRNSVGVAEHPETGGIYTVENSVDEMTRDGKDVHQDNPGEEMNFHGYLNGTEYARQGSNYGYPTCFAAWMPNDLPQNANLTVGSQFAIGDQNDTINDTFCSKQTPPRLTFQAHMAPLDIDFNNSGSEAWITFHGSWDRTNPVGYKLSVIPFENGEPVAAPDNNTAATDILVNPNNSICREDSPGNCIRPVGIAFDSLGRLFMSSDDTGEIYVVMKEQGSNTPSATTPGSSPSATSSSKSDAEKQLHYSLSVLLLTAFIYYIAL